MTSRAVQAESERTADALAGSAQLEVVGGELGVPESLLLELGSAPGVLTASPLINAVVRVAGGRVPVHVLGIDLTLAAEARDLDVRAGGIRIQDPLRLLARPDSVLITTALAHKLGVGLGGSVRVQSQVGTHDLRIEGLLEEEGLASAFNGQVAVMDVYALQAMLHRNGVVDRIDVVAQPGQDVSSLAIELDRQVDGAATVRRVGIRRSGLDQTIAALRVAVVIVAAIGALVSGLLSYAAMSTSVERRLQEFSVLRSTGISARSIASWISLEAIATGIIGTLIGILAGWLLAGRLVPTLSNVSEYFDASAISRADVAITGSTIALAIAVGVICTLCGTIEPTRIATKRYALDPSELIGSRERHGSRPWVLRLLVVALVAFCVAPSLSGVPSALRTILILGLGTIVVVRSVIPGLEWLDRNRPLMSRALPGTGHLIGTGLRVRPNSTALAVGAIAALVAFVHGAIIVSASFSGTLLALVEARYPDAMLVTATSPFVDSGTGIVRHDVVKTVRSTPGVDTVIERYSSTVLVKGDEVSIVAFPAEIPAAHAGTTLRLDEGLRLALLAGEVAVSSAFARRFDLEPGDSVELSTPRHGRRAFRIAGELPGLAGPAGVIFVDLATFDSFWQRPGATNVYVWISGERNQVIEEVQRRTSDRQDLFFTNGGELMNGARVFAARFDGLLYGVGTLAIVLGAISIANLLAGMVAARRLEFALLRSAGASPMQLSAVVVGDALVVSIVGIVAGTTLGVLLSFPMLDLMSAEFGLSVERHFDLSKLGLLAISVMISVAASAVYPALLARRSIDPEIAHT